MSEQLPLLRHPQPCQEGVRAVVVEAVAAVQEAYGAGRLDIVTEADLQGHLFAALAARLEGTPIPLHAWLPLKGEPGPVDLVIGSNSVAIELKLEARYPEMPSTKKNRVDWKLAREDFKKLGRLLSRGGVQHGYFVMLNESGAHLTQPEVRELWVSAGGSRAEARWLFVEIIVELPTITGS